MTDEKGITYRKLMQVLLHLRNDLKKRKVLDYDFIENFLKEVYSKSGMEENMRYENAEEFFKDLNTCITDADTYHMITKNFGFIISVNKKPAIIENFTALIIILKQIDFISKYIKSLNLIGFNAEILVKPSWFSKINHKVFLTKDFVNYIIENKEYYTEFLDKNYPKELGSKFFYKLSPAIES